MMTELVATTTAVASLLNAEQTAKRLAISPRTLWSLTNTKEIPHLRIGRAVRYDPRDLDVWIERRKREALR
jgi:excisionase family DNA binding protein